MASSPRFRRRNSYRLKGYDYSQPGAYFITANCINREHLFGEIVKHKMILSKYGLIAQDQWLATPLIRPNIELGEFIIMPDHLHGIIIIKERCVPKIEISDLNPVEFKTLSGCIAIHPDKDLNSTEHEFSKLRSPSQTLGAIMRGFMGTVTSKINQCRDTPGAKVWQRNYYDHIIKDPQSFKSISRYIIKNPLKWKENINDPGFS